MSLLWKRNSAKHSLSSISSKSHSIHEENLDFFYVFKSLRRSNSSSDNSSSSKLLRRSRASSNDAMICKQ